MREIRGYTIINPSIPGLAGAIFSVRDWDWISYQSDFGGGDEVETLGSEPGLHIPSSIEMLPSGRFRAFDLAVTRLDTPVTHFYWERGAFSLNLFRLNFRRALLQNAVLSLQFSAIKSEQTDYKYSFQVQQPFLNLGNIPGIRRDSTDLVLAGVAPAIDVFNVRPSLDLRLGKQTISKLYWEKIDSQTDEVSPISDPDSIDHDFFKEPKLRPVAGTHTSNKIGVNLYHQGLHYQINSNYTYTNREASVPIFHPGPIMPWQKDSSMANNFDIHDVMLSYALLGLPWRPSVVLSAHSLNFEGPLFLGEFKSNQVDSQSQPASVGWMDTQSFGIRLAPRTGQYQGAIEAGVDRTSHMNDKRAWGYYIRSMHVLKPIRYFNMEVFTVTETHQPNYRRMFIYNPFKGYFPNSGLQVSQNNRVSGRLSFEPSRYSVYGGVGLSHLKDPILPAILPKDGRVLSDSSALMYVNHNREYRVSGTLGGRVTIGHWVLNTEYNRLIANSLKTKGIADTLTSNTNTQIPETVINGRLHWSNRYVKNKLGVQAQFDWAWFKHRYLWAAQLDGTSKAIKMDEFLNLDFQASMNIQQFYFFYRIDTMYYDHYHITPGRYLPGINFRWGIVWKLLI